MSREKIIQECIDALNKIITPNCHDHTPYRGPCLSCGQYDNPDVLDPEEAIQELELLKSLKK